MPATPRDRRPGPSPEALSDRIRSLLAPFLHRRTFAAGEVLWESGDEAGMLVSIDTGRVKIFRGKGSKEVTLYLFGPGDTFGFLPFLDGRPYPAGAKALTPLETRVMPRGELVAAFRSDPSIALALVEVLAARLREAFERIERSASPEVLPRVAAALAALLPDPVRGGELTVIELPVRAHELARAIDVVPETFSRAVTSLVKSAVIHRLGPRRFQVLDVTALRRAARDPLSC